MANAKKCDRCGKFYLFNKEFLVDHHGDCYIGGITTMTTGGFHHQNYDLCDDCLKDFNEFIRDSVCIRKIVQDGGCLEIEFK